MATFTAVILMLTAIVSSNVDGKVINNKRQPSDECAMSLMTCFASFQRTFSSGDLMDTILDDGLTNACPPLIDAKNCFEGALRACDDNEPFRQTVKAIVEIIRFVCEQEVRVLDANRQCLFGPETTAALRAECPAHGLGHMCSLLADNECAFRLIGQKCENPALATKIRDFVKKIQREAGCRTARSMRDLLEELIQF